MFPPDRAGAFGQRRKGVVTLRGMDPVYERRGAGEPLVLLHGIGDRGLSQRCVAHSASATITKTTMMPA